MRVLFPTSRPIVVFALLLFIVPMFGPGGQADDPVETCAKQYVPAVGEACRLPNGLWQIVLPDGHVQTTHGADPYVPDEETAALSANERHPHCATDYYQHVLYGYPADGENRYLDVVDDIRAAIRRMNYILNEDGVESGGVTADYKVLCHEDYQIRVDAFPNHGSSDFYDVVNAARAAGFYGSNVDFTIFYDGTSSGVCGVGHISYDERGSQYNHNNNGNDYGVTYNNCWNGRTPMHENGHNQGAVQRTAPDSDGAGHCIEGQDIMCYPTSAILVLCRDRTHFDCDHDTYFDTDPEPGEWLDTRWNIGARYNRFIAFDVEPQINTTDPAPDFNATVDGKSVAFDASASYDEDGDPLTYTWNFGDNSAGSGVQTTHTYAEAGKYRVTLSLSDGQGGFASLTKDVYISPDVDPSIETLTFEGVVECAVAVSPQETKDACGGPTSTDHEFAVDKGITGVHVELVWDRATGAALGALGAEEMRYIWYRPGLGDASGTSPVVGEHAVDPSLDLHLSGGRMLLHVRPSGTSGLVVDQAYKVCVSVLYGGATAPSGPTCTL